MEKEVVVTIPKGFGTITIKLVIEEECNQSVFNVVDRNGRNDVDQHSELIIKPNPTRS